MYSRLVRLYCKLSILSTYVEVKTDHILFISECLVSEEVQDVFCLCSKGELSKYRVQWLLQELSGAGLTVHHYPFPDGQPPATSQLMKILKELKTILNNQRKPIIQYDSQISHFVLDYSL